jgi:uncharacterized secreted protein with C-terminal beta-propeller domain
MDSKRIKKLLDKYYQGETSLEEQEILKEYFNNDSLQNGNNEDKMIFNYLQSEKSVIPADLTETLDKIIDNEAKKNKTKVVKIVRWAGSIAAILLIGILFLVFGKVENKTIEKTLYADTYSDPEQAFKETQKVLLFISKTMNKKSTGIQHLAEIDKSLKKCNELSKIDETLNSVKK